MKKVMILGAGKGQVPFIEICKDKGYEVLVVGIEGNYPGLKLADKVFFVDIRDKEGVLKIAQDEKIDAILTDQMDISVPTVAFVAEKMGLRGIGYETSLKYTNKYLMRMAAKEVGVPVPEFDESNNINDAIEIANRIGYPLMIKPVDSSGSRGVIKINSEEELVENFEISKKFSTTDYVILEQFLEGKPFIVNGIAIDNEYNNLDIAEKSYFDAIGVFVTNKCVFESAKYVTDHVKKVVLETNKKLVDGVGLVAGLTHADYLYNEQEDKAYLVEIAARGGGQYISSYITPNVTGFNSNEALIEYIVEGKVINYNNQSIDNNVSGYICFTLPEGKISAISGVDNVNSIEGVSFVEIEDLYVGKNTKLLETNSDKYGPIIFLTKNVEDAQLVMNKVRNTIEINVERDNKNLSVIW